MFQRYWTRGRHTTDLFLEMFVPQRSPCLLGIPGPLTVVNSILTPKLRISRWLYCWLVETCLILWILPGTTLIRPSFPPPPPPATTKAVGTSPSMFICLVCKFELSVCWLRHFNLKIYWDVEVKDRNLPILISWLLRGHIMVPDQFWRISSFCALEKRKNARRHSGTKSDAYLPYN